MVFAVFLAGCAHPPVPVIPIIPVGSRSEENTNITENDIYVVYASIVADGRIVELTFVFPENYVLKIDGVAASQGTMFFDDNDIATFTSTAGETFRAQGGSYFLIFFDTIITDAGESLSVTELGYKNTDYHEELPFILSITGAELSINVFGRGDGTNVYQPTNPNCDKWVLQDAGNKGTFPIGTWVSSHYGDESLLFTAKTLTIDSPFDTYMHDYTIEDGKLVLSNRYLMSHVLTSDEQEYIVNFHSKYEAAFREAHPWIPVTSTINPKSIKQGYDYQIADHPDMTFVNDPDVLGTWLVCDFTDDPAGYDPARPVQPGADYWSGLKFEANGVLRHKIRVNADWQLGSWTKNLLCIRTVAPTYEIKTFPAGTYIFVQWKLGDYTGPALKPSYYVFKKQ
jgi:hypothetical protein